MNSFQLELIDRQNGDIEIIFRYEGIDWTTGEASDGGNADTVNGQDGNDTLRGGDTDDDLRDVFYGGAGDDFVDSSSGNDEVYGGEGNDTITGGFGFYRLNGGAGADEFFHLGIVNHGSDWIQDYDGSADDVLVFCNTSATREQFQINDAFTTGAGDADVADAFIIFRPIGHIVWAPVDGMGPDKINLQIGGNIFDLML